MRGRLARSAPQVRLPSSFPQGVVNQTFTELDYELRRRLRFTKLGLEVKMSSLKNRAAIIGIADLKPTKRSEEKSMELAAKVGKLAIQDAGLEMGEIDGLLTGVDNVQWSMLVGEYLGLPPGYRHHLELQGATGAGMVWRAAAAINAGLCNTVLCIAAASNRERARGGEDRASMPAQFMRPYDPVGGANSRYALIAQRHMYEYGTTSGQLAKVAVDQRTNACGNPEAIFYGQPITIADVLDSPLICDPLHLLDIVMRIEGGSALVITSAQRAKRAATPVWLLGAGERLNHDSAIYSSLTTSPVKDSAEMAFRMAKVTPKQIDLVSLYDCYTITVVVTLEDAGFCKKGQGGKFVEETDLTYKGRLPCNTHGGQLSFGQAGGHGGGMSHVTEASRQLMGRGGARQVANPKLAFVQGNGGTMNEEVSLILGV